MVQNHSTSFNRVSKRDSTVLDGVEWQLLNPTEMFMAVGGRLTVEIVQLTFRQPVFMANCVNLNRKLT